MFFIKNIAIEFDDHMVGINMWMDLFKKVILERGYEYFESGKIKDIHWDGNTVYGKVNGTEEYNVSAEIDGENVHMQKVKKSVNIWLLYYLKY